MSPENKLMDSGFGLLWLILSDVYVLLSLLNLNFYSLLIELGLSLQLHLQDNFLLISAK